MVITIPKINPKNFSWDLFQLVYCLLYSFGLLIVSVSKSERSKTEDAIHRTKVLMSLYYPLLYYFAIPESKGAKYFDCSHLSHIPSLSWSYP